MTADENGIPNESGPPEEIDFLPGIEPFGGSLAGAEQYFIDMGVIEAYRRFIGKMEPIDRGRDDGIMVSCPIPGHEDRNPSAWMNKVKGTWYCGGCAQGGDIIDLCAIGLGAPFPEYKSDPRLFVQTLERALMALGIDPNHVRAINDGTATVSSPRAEKSREATPPGELSTNPNSDTQTEQDEQDPMTGVPAGIDSEDIKGGMSDLDWDNLFAAETEIEWRELLEPFRYTFLWNWMEATEVEDIPDTYLLWIGLQLVGLAVGRNCHIRGNIFPNLPVALLGRTASGKSRALRMAHQVLNDALPFNRTDPDSEGVDLIPTVGSGEALIDALSWCPDLVSPDPRGKRSYIDFDEMRQLMETAGRRGSTLRETLITAMDCPNHMDQRTRGGGEVQAADVFLTVCTGAQPEAMSKILDRNDAASGFANRFIYVGGRQKPMQPWVDQKTADLTGLGDQLKLVRTWSRDHKRGPDKGNIAIGDIAADRFDEIRSWFREIRERPDGDMYARLELHAIRLVIILCANSKDDVADEDIINAVHKLIDSTLPSTGEVSQAVNRTVDQYYRDRIVQAIERCMANGTRPPSVSDVNRTLRHDKRDKEALYRAVKYLVDIGMVKVHIDMTTTGIGAKRAVERYYLADEGPWEETSQPA